EVQPWAVVIDDDQSILHSKFSHGTTKLATLSREKVDELKEKLKSELDDSQVPPVLPQSVEKHKDFDEN
ncbi:unnamed protein product, partial [Didymodactylos carnosus]